MKLSEKFCEKLCEKTRQISSAEEVFNKGYQWLTQPRAPLLRLRNTASYPH